MRKTFLFVAALVAGGLVFSGCVYMDTPHPAITQGSKIKCIGVCGEDDPGQGWADGIMGTAGPTAYYLPNEEGNFYNLNQELGLMEEGEAPEACLWEVGGGGGGAGPVRLDTIWDPVADEASGCPPFTYECGWGTFPLESEFDFCSPLPHNAQPYLCGIGNGACRGPYSGHVGLPGSWWYNSPANTANFGVNYICVDENPTPGSNEFDLNIRRQPGAECGECGTGASALQAPPGKTVVCHIPPGNPGNEHTIIVGDAAVPAHLAHGDHLGECSGGGPAGAGHEVPAGNDGPVWSLGLGWNVDTNIYLVGEGAPWTDDYSSCIQGLCGGTGAAIDRIADVFASNPVDENGMSTISISKLRGFGETTELSPPLNVHIRMQVVRKGWPAFNYAVDATQTSWVTFLQWASQNFPDKTAFTGAGISFELTSGHTLEGTTLAAALPYAVAFNADRIAEHAVRVSEADFESRDLEQRVAIR